MFSLRVSGIRQASQSQVHCVEKARGFLWGSPYFWMCRKHLDVDIGSCEELTCMRSMRYTSQQELQTQTLELSFAG